MKSFFIIATVIATSASLAADPPSRPTPIKAGVIVSLRSARDLAARRHEDGYKDQIEMVKALHKKPEVDLFIIIDPGSADQDEIPKILQQYTTPDHVIDGSSVDDLKKLNVVVSGRNYLPDSVFNAVVKAVHDEGVGLLKTMQIGRENQNADFAPAAAEQLLGIDAADYYWPNRETTARIVADHPILREFAQQNITTLRARPNGYTGKIPGTPLIEADIDPPPNGPAPGTYDRAEQVHYCFLYAAQLGKGKIIVGQWLRIPPEILKVTKGRFYIHCLQYLTDRPID